MKTKLFITAALFMLSSLFFTNLKAQEQTFSLGGGLSYATHNIGTGIFVKGLYSFNEKWEGSASFTYFFPKKYYGVTLNFSALDIDAHYIFYNNEENFSFYGLSGLDILFANGSYNGNSSSGSTLGFNLGCGLRYLLSEKLALNPEIKFVIPTKSDNNYLSISAGVTYSF